MSGFKKGLLISIAVVVLLVALWILLPKLKLNKNYPDPLAALPDNAVLFFKGDNFRSDNIFKFEIPFVQV